MSLLLIFPLLKYFFLLLLKIYVSKYFWIGHTCKKSSENFLSVCSIQHFSGETRTELHGFLFVLNFYASSRMLQNTLHINESTPSKNQEFCQSRGGVKGKSFKYGGYSPLNYIMLLQNGKVNSNNLNGSQW